MTVELRILTTDRNISTLRTSVPRNTSLRYAGDFNAVDYCDRNPSIHRLVGSED